VIGSLLRDLRVIDLSIEIAGSYTSKLLADAGADVVKIEPQSGDPLRNWCPPGQDSRGSSALFEFLNASKRSLMSSGVASEALALARSADIVIENGQLTDADLASIRRRRRELVVTSISPFGRRGPWSKRPATEFTLQAACGSTASRGWAEREPLFAGGRLGEWITGSYAAAATLAAAIGARRTGQGEYIDVSMLECMLVAFGGYAALNRSLGAPLLQNPARSVELPSIEPTRDGYIGFCTITRQQFRDFLVLIGQPELVDDEELASYTGRHRRRDEFLRLVHGWTRERNAAEIESLASELRIPVAPVSTPSSVFRVDHFGARGVFVKNPGGFLQPSPPYRLDGRRKVDFKQAPSLGEHNGRLGWAPRAAATEEGQFRGCQDTSEPPLPLEGIRIVDLTCFWAGPAATHLLASLGADVIKVESLAHPDGMRLSTGRTPSTDRWWEYSGHFLANNAGKRGITLDLDDSEGRNLLLRLVAISDALVENFSPRVLDNFGLTWSVVQQANPQAIMVRMPAFGLDGPWRDRTGFAQTMEQASGLAWLTGYPDGPPIIPRGPCDPLAGMHAAFVLLACLYERDLSHQGHFVESTMIEAALNAAAGMAVEYSAYGFEAARSGNRDRSAAPQGVYQCGVRDEWLALTVTTDEQWKGLVKTMGSPLWALDSAYSSAFGRRRAHDQIDAGISAWASTCNRDEAVEKLLESQVPASAVLDPPDAWDNEQVRFRKFLESVEHQVVGAHEVPGMPFRFGTRSQPWNRSSAPVLGQHNLEVLQGLLGVPREVVASLERAGVVGDRLHGD
jgi:crotonobetainyl-CoA:carnitine CoA-transferase CaiB-like acyl-CoA transferase